MENNPKLYEKKKLAFFISAKNAKVILVHSGPGPFGDL